MRFPRILLPLLAAAVAAPLLAQAPADVTPDQTATPVEPAAIPPGMEPLFAEMLGSGQSLPGGCKFTDGQIARTVALATYACQDGQVVLELRHPDAAPPGSMHTRSFALLVKSGTPPQGLTDAIAERIRAREGAFAWKTFGGGGGEAPPIRTLLAIAVGILIAAVLVWVVRGSRSKRSASGK